MTNDPRSYPGPIKECWAIHEVLRSLGFMPEDIFVATGKSADMPFAHVALFVILRAQGKEFIVPIAGYQSEIEVNRALSQWTEFVEGFTSGAFNEGTMQSIYHSSSVMKNSAQFVLALHNKGIKPLIGIN